MVAIRIAESQRSGSKPIIPAGVRGGSPGSPAANRAESLTNRAADSFRSSLPQAHLVAETGRVYSYAVRVDGRSSMVYVSI